MYIKFKVIIYISKADTLYLPENHSVKDNQT